MATLVLQTIGSVVGGAVGGPIGAAIGRLAGGLGGAAIDAALRPHTPPRYSIGPRLKSMDGITSTEGAGVPRVYGRARLGGQMIWATRFREQVNVSFEPQQQSGKGSGSSTTYNVHHSYSYFANFAIAICEGPIAYVRRIWADGAELDMTTLPIRIYKGAETQTPDPLIAAKEGAENAPAYRGLAYIVFDNLALASFGNRIPQFTFEVVKPVAGLGAMIRAVDLIPGATEAGYMPQLKLNFWSPGVSVAENRHQLTAATDWRASIDALQALCPNLESVALVVTWFGDDLRAGHCTITPRVETRFKTIGQFNWITGASWPPDWSVAGQTRLSARLVSQIAGRPAYGGTPSDASVIGAIADLKARGLKVVFYPFVMMDVPESNTLPNPYTGAAGQPAFPWRGRITCDPAPGRAGTVDLTGAATTQVNAFFAQYRPFILHCASLCVAAGGVDAFLIGSELIGLTRIRSGAGQYPAVAALAALAGDVKALVGAQTKVSYAADWTEYGAHVPANGELRFPLDPLWGSPAVDFVGVDVYWPLSDWRDGDAHLDAALAQSVNDLDYLKSRVASGEGYDWYYADADARAAQLRTPITDKSELPHEIALSYADSENDFQPARVLSRRLEGLSARQSEAQAAVMTHRANAQKLADIWLQDLWVGRERAQFILRPGLVGLQPGDLVRLGDEGRLFQIQRIADGVAREVEARAVDPNVYDTPAPALQRVSAPSPKFPGPPRVEILDLALMRDDEALSYMAGFADPWPGALAVWRQAPGGGYEAFARIEKRATIGDTLDALPPGPVGRFDKGGRVTVRFGGGALSSVGDLAALDGRASMAIRGDDGAWEIVGFAQAELVGENTYRLARLLRGLGSETHLASRSVASGATVVLLNDALISLARKTSEIGAPATWRVGPADRDYADPLFVQATIAATNKALKPYAPTQAQAARTPSGVVIAFTRRGRIDSDAWEAVDIPLGEDVEAYEADIALPGGSLRRLSGASPSLLYAAADELADFGAPQSALSLSIFQMSARIGRSFPLTTTLPVE